MGEWGWGWGWEVVIMGLSMEGRDIMGVRAVGGLEDMEVGMVDTGVVLEGGR